MLAAPALVRGVLVDSAARQRLLAARW